jgi:hypothetical protein
VLLGSRGNNLALVVDEESTGASRTYVDAQKMNGFLLYALSRKDTETFAEKLC